MSQNGPAPSGGGSDDSTHFWTEVGGAAGVVGVVVARFAIPRNDAGSGRDGCTAIPPAAWTATLDNMFHLPTGSHLCVQTDQGNRRPHAHPYPFCR
ncbi:hypothetical protein [Nocardia brasiliensis]|uniref:hypothetical protein n=1 Tax=Nocardia brasiliensis TaxID=37326 RepID=UPI003672ABBF